MIYPASMTTNLDRVRGGKGDDIINPVELVFDDSGMLLTDLTDSANQSVYGTNANW